MQTSALSLYRLVRVVRIWMAAREHRQVHDVPSDFRGSNNQYVRDNLVKTVFAETAH